MFTTMRIGVLARFRVLGRALNCGVISKCEILPFLFYGILSAIDTQLIRGGGLRKHYCNYLTKKVRRRYFDATNERYDFNGVYLPDFDSDIITRFFSDIFCDQIYLHCIYNDDYTRIDVDEYAKLCEGPYCYPFDGNNVVVEPGDVVIDAGAWIGDFGIWAQYCGASTCYSFEPLEGNYNLLQETARINPAIVPIKLGLSDRKKQLVFTTEVEGSTGGSFVNGDGAIGGKKLDLIDLDTFTKERGLTRVDFIKADIEGAERDMLRGAAWVLKTFEPRLSLCTYHLPDDPEVMRSLILEANPNYVFHQGPMKLFAWVESR